MVILANREDTDDMQYYAAFHQCLHCLLRLKQHLGAEIHHNFENSACDPLKYTMGSPNTYGKIHQNTKWLSMNVKIPSEDEGLMFG